MTLRGHKLKFHHNSVPKIILSSEMELNTADNQLNAKPVVKQRHLGDEFPVSL